MAYRLLGIKSAFEQQTLGSLHVVAPASKTRLMSIDTSFV